MPERTEDTDLFIIREAMRAYKEAPPSRRAEVLKPFTKRLLAKGHSIKDIVWFYQAALT
jgi:hypothetical protein